MSQKRVWEGIYPAVTTKFKMDDSLDIDEMERCYALQIDGGVDGLIVCGSLGEASTLNAVEKLDILKAALRVSGSKPVLLTISDGATRDAQKMAETGARAGAAGFMVLPGIPYRSNRQETVTHFRAVAGAGNLPVMIYNNPVSYGVDLTPDWLEELAADPLFIAVKESSDDVRRVTEIIRRMGDRFEVFAGVDNLALESFAMGAVGWVAGLAAAFPEETVAVWRLARAGRIDEALRVYRWFRPLLDLDVSTNLVQSIKLVESLAIKSNDRCRAPRLPLAGEDRKRVTAIFQSATANRVSIPKL